VHWVKNHPVKREILCHCVKNLGNCEEPVVSAYLAGNTFKKVVLFMSKLSPSDWECIAYALSQFGHNEQFAETYEKVMRIISETN